MSYTYKNIGRSKLKEQPSNPLNFKLKNGSIKFSHLSLDALEGIKAWLEGHPGPGPTPPTTTFTIYYGFADASTIEGVTGLESREVESEIGEYNVVNPTDGLMFYIAVPSNITIDYDQVTIKDDFGYFPMREDETLTIDGEIYTRYKSTGSDLGYKAGFYPFVIS